VVGEREAGEVVDIVGLLVGAAPRGQQGLELLKRPTQADPPVWWTGHGCVRYSRIWSAPLRTNARYHGQLSS
jgi:hypothetical protein